MLQCFKKTHLHDLEVLDVKLACDLIIRYKALSIKAISLLPTEVGKKGRVEYQEKVLQQGVVGIEQASQSCWSSRRVRIWGLIFGLSYVEPGIRIIDPCGNLPT